MSYATARHTGNGSVTSFALGFTFVLVAHVKVYLNGALQTTGYTVSGGNVVFDVAPASGVAVLARRETSPTVRLVDYVDGSTLTEAVLDMDSQQAFNMAQEALTNASESVRLNALNKMDAGGFRITNVADPVDPQDLATRVWVETAPSSALSAAIAAKDAALASETAAAASAAAALASQDAASTSQSAAAGSASTATAQADIATTQAGTATTQAGIATTKADEASASEVNAALSYSSSITQAGIATTKAGEADASAIAAAASAVAADDSADLAASYAGQVGTMSFRNKLINGNFNFWQRGSSQTSSNYASADRWMMDNVGSTKVASLQAYTAAEAEALGSNPRYYLRHVVTSVAGAGNFVNFNQRIESVRTLAGKSVTISFVARADAAKNIAIEFVQNFGTGGSPSAEVNTVGAQQIALTTVFQRFTRTITIPSIAGKTLGSAGDDFLGIWFWLESGATYAARSASIGQQSGTFEVGEIQVEIGSVATPFEQRPMQVELALCQRYYQTLGPVYWSGYVAAANTRYNSYPLPVPMRAAPNSHALTGFVLTNCGAPVVTYAGDRVLTIDTAVTAAGEWLMHSGTAALSAEL